MKTTFTIKTVPETKFGCDILSTLIDILEPLSIKNILVVVDKAMREQGLTDPLEKLFHNTSWHVSMYIIDEPVLSINGLREAYGSIKSRPADVVIGFGGWRCTDLAKFLALTKNIDIAFEKLISDFSIIDKRGIPIISIPTTPPNGAEIDSKILIRNISEKKLLCLDHSFLVPMLTVVDPNLMLTLPHDLTASTGLDALGHAIESLISVESTPFSEILAIQSLALLSENLVDSYKQPDNIRARYNVALGSLLAALALNTTGSGAVHALAYPLTARYGIPHPQASALLLPHVIKYNIPVVPDEYSKIARLFGFQLTGADSDAEKAYELITSLYRTLEHPTRLTSYNIPGIDLHELTHLALEYRELLQRNPRIVDADHILNIYRNAF